MCFVGAAEQVAESNSSAVAVSGVSAKIKFTT